MHAFVVCCFAVRYISDNAGYNSCNNSNIFLYNLLHNILNHAMLSYDYMFAVNLLCII